MAVELVEKEYRLAGDVAPIASIQKVGTNGALLVFDTKKKQNRAIRHCLNESSPYLEDQSTYAMVSPIIFEKGYFKTKPTDRITQWFLDIHPDNVANGGSKFEEVNDELEAEESLEREDLVVDLKSLVREKQKMENGLFELQTAASVIKNSYVEASKMSMPELRQVIYGAIDRNPYSFTEKDEKGNVTLTLFDEESKRKYLSLRSIGEGLVKVTPDGRNIIWGDTKDMIVSIPAGRKATDFFAEYLETDDGMLVLDRIENEL